jgi:hypothetical protein
MPSSHQVPPRISDHELLRLIGRGSYGQVWLARTIMGSFRAVKIVYRDSFDSDRPYDREFGGLQKFEPVSRSHSGLVNILHVGKNMEAGCFYCVMEVADDLSDGQAINPETYVPRSLSKEIAQRGRLPVDEAVQVGLKLADALSYLHGRGLIHRDIKPSNIIFVGDQPKLADVGLVAGAGTRASFVGTEAYIPPEGPGSPGADIFSLGKVFYEMSMGKLAEEFPELPTRLREFPDAPRLMRLNSVVLKACEPQPAKRFRSARELAEAMGELARQNLSLPGAKAVGAKLGGLRTLVLAGSASGEEGDLAAQIVSALSNQGGQVFLDRETALSLTWGRQIEEQIRLADAIVLILSAPTLQSPTMAYALEMASQTARRPGRAPVRLAVWADSSLVAPRQVALALEGARALAASEGGAEGIVEAIVNALKPAPPEPPGT